MTTSPKAVSKRILILWPATASRMRQHRMPLARGRATSERTVSAGTRKLKRKFKTLLGSYVSLLSWPDFVGLRQHSTSHLDDMKDKLSVQFARQQEDDLELMKERMQETLMTLANFNKRREEGRTRKEYLGVLHRDLCAYYGYNEFLMEKFMEIFPNGSEVITDFGILPCVAVRSLFS